jgi:hypothetical protein
MFVALTFTRFDALSLRVCVCLTNYRLHSPILTTHSHVYMCVCVSQVHVTVTFGHHGIEDSHKQASLKKRDSIVAASDGRPAGAIHGSEAEASGHGGGGFTMSTLPGLKTFSHFHIPDFSADGDGDGDGDTLSTKTAGPGASAGAATSSAGAAGPAVVGQRAQGRAPLVIPATPATPAAAGTAPSKDSKPRDDLGGLRDPGRASLERPPVSRLSTKEQQIR